MDWSAELAERFTGVFHRYDMNGDGVVDRDEWTALIDRITKAKDSKPEGVRAMPNQDRALRRQNPL